MAQPIQSQPGYQAGYQTGYDNAQYTQPPVMQQPGMALQPVPPANCPPGLEYLTQIDQLVVKQIVELLEAITTFETKNKYKIFNSMGQDVFSAFEDTDCCVRQCCGPNRPFDMQIFDNGQHEVIHLNRPLRCSCCWCSCCLQEVEVTAPPGTPIGYVVQNCSICKPSFDICDADKNTILKIDGPCCQINCCCRDVEFQVMDKEGETQVGKISKQFSGFVKEAFTDADTFSITFPMDLDVKAKATLLGACFLIDFMFFEDNSQRK